MVKTLQFFLINFCILKRVNNFTMIIRHFFNCGILIHSISQSSSKFSSKLFIVFCIKSASVVLYLSFYYVALLLPYFSQIIMKWTIKFVRFLFFLQQVSFYRIAEVMKRKMPNEEDKWDFKDKRRMSTENRLRKVTDKDADDGLILAMFLSQLLHKKL